MIIYPITQEELLLLSYDFEDSLRKDDAHADVFVVALDFSDEYMVVADTMYGRENYQINIRTGEWIKHVTQ